MLWKFTIFLGVSPHTQENVTTLRDYVVYSIPCTVSQIKISKKWEFPVGWCEFFFSWRDLLILNFDFLVLRLGEKHNGYPGSRWE